MRGMAYHSKGQFERAIQDRYMTLNIYYDLLPTEWVKTGELLRFHADFKGFLVNSPVTG
jgi:hypothetical protein